MQPQLQLSQQELQQELQELQQGLAIGQAGHGHGVMTGQGQGAAIPQGHGLAHGQAANDDWIPNDKATRVNNATNVFFIIKISFSIGYLISYNKFNNHSKNNL